jgi:hypothetical protein
VAAKHALDASLEVAAIEASDALGGQWHKTAASGSARAWRRCGRDAARFVDQLAAPMPVAA